MDSSGSFLKTVLSRGRGMVDDPDVDAKYPDDYLVRHAVLPVMVDVMARLNLSSDNPIVIRYAVNLTAGTRYYQLPPCVQEIHRLVMLDAEGNVIADAYPRGAFNPQGAGWLLEGNILQVDPSAASDRTIHIFYVPNGDYVAHYAAAGGVLLIDTSGTLPVHRVQLSDAPALGYVDTRENAYAGGMLRILSGDLPITEERVISRSYYDEDTEKWYAEVRIPFTRHATDEMEVVYEVCPMGSQPLYEAIACGIGMKLGTWRNKSQAQMSSLLFQYRAALKTIMDNLTNLQMRTGKVFDKATVDNQNFLMLG